MIDRTMDSLEKDSIPYPLGISHPLRPEKLINDHILKSYIFPNLNPNSIIS